MGHPLGHRETDPRDRKLETATMRTTPDKTALSAPDETQATLEAHAADARPLAPKEVADVAGGFAINPKLFPEPQRSTIVRLNGWDADHGKK